MLLITKVISVISCGVLLCLGLSQAAHAADEVGASRLEQATVIKENLVSIEYGDYKEKDGKEVRVHIDKIPR